MTTPKRKMLSCDRWNRLILIINTLFYLLSGGENPTGQGKLYCKRDAQCSSWQCMLVYKCLATSNNYLLVFRLFIRLSAVILLFVCSLFHSFVRCSICSFVRSFLSFSFLRLLIRCLVGWLVGPSLPHSPFCSYVLSSVNLF